MRPQHDKVWRKGLRAASKGIPTGPRTGYVPTDELAPAPTPEQIDAMLIIGGPRRPEAITILVSPAERDHIDLLRLQSYELAIERGHLRYG